MNQSVRADKVFLYMDCRNHWGCRRDQKSVNLQLNTLGRLDDGTNRIVDQASDVPSIISFHDFLQKSHKLVNVVPNCKFHHSSFEKLVSFFFVSVSLV